MAAKAVQRLCAGRLLVAHPSTWVRASVRTTTTVQRTPNRLDQLRPLREATSGTSSTDGGKFMGRATATGAVVAVVGSLLWYASESNQSVWQVLRIASQKAVAFYSQRHHHAASDEDLEELLRELLPAREAIEAGARRERNEAPHSTPPMSPHLPADAEQLALTPTVVLALDGICLDVSYDPQLQHGFGTAVRPGLVSALLALAEADCEVVLWSSKWPAQDAATLFSEKVLPAVIEQDRHRYVAFQRYLREQLEDRYEARYGTREGAAAYASAMLSSPSEMDDKYTKALLHVTAVLGVEHCSGGGSPTTAGATAAMKRPDLLPRSRRDVLVVDADPATCARFRANALQLLPVARAIRAALAAEKEEEAGAAACSRDEAGAPAAVAPAAKGAAAEALFDLDLVAAFVRLYKAAATARLQQQQQQLLQAGGPAPTLPSSAPREAQVAPREELLAGEAAVTAHAECIRDWLRYFRGRDGANAAEKSSSDGNSAAAARSHGAAGSGTGSEGDDSTSVLAAVAAIIRR